MHPSNFDELTKTLAETRSRRQALRVILTASIGGLLGLTSVSTAFGRHRTKKTNKPSGPPPGNSNCAKFCAAVFGPNTPAANQCTSDAAHNKPGSLCKKCGSGNASSVCCNRNGSGFCDGTAGATCCDPGTCSDNGQPCTPSNKSLCGNPATAVCVGGNSCLSGTCCPNANVCGSTCGCPMGQHCDNGDCVADCTATGGTCTVNTDCCSNNCQSGHCGCASGCTLLANGTCARPCGMSGSCTCGEFCGGAVSNPSGFCGSSHGNGNGCASDVECPTGSYCNVGHICVDACC